MRPRILGITRAVLCACVVAALFANNVPSAQTPSGPHDYFNALVARGDHWKSYSFRDPRQLVGTRYGGYAVSSSESLWVTYDPANDDDPQRQDAAKAVIPAFAEQPDLLMASVGPSDVFLRLADGNGDSTRVTTAFNSRGRQIRIGTEIMLATEWPAPCPASNLACNPLDRTTGVLHVTRGAHGTAPMPHGARAEALYLGNNNLPNQVRVPLGTTNGNTYLFTWDSYHTDSFKDTGVNSWKSFQFSSNSLWLEVQTRSDGGGAGGASCFVRSQHIASIEMRAYPSSGVGGAANWMLTDGNQMGPGTLGVSPILPRRAEFCQVPGRWVRSWVLIEQRANDYDYMSFWLADEDRNAVQIYDRIPLSVEPDSKPIADRISEFWIELNSSWDKLSDSRARDGRDLVVYVRNFVALINPPDDLSFLLVRPAIGATPPSPVGRPIAPRNLRGVVP